MISLKRCYLLLRIPGLLAICLLSVGMLHSQTLYQSIRGSVVDRSSHNPLAGATISLVESAEQVSAISDSLGQFILHNVPVGRRKIQCTYIGYQAYVTEPFIINTAKEPELVIELDEAAGAQQAVMVTAKRNPKAAVNKYATVSTRSFSPEETQRFAASANDPGRMAMAFPGVQPTTDARSDIVIRGNNPLGMQWRVEGVDIPNPNHFARKGSSGGGITIFSLSMLDNSDFSTGGMPAEYGNVLSGIFDVRFRKGNNQEAEYTFKAGMIGIDFSTEGPIKKNQSSYLVNYRYSTLGLLNAIGVNLVDEREDNKFQDLSFNFSFANKKNTSVINVWGMGGISKETMNAVKDTADWKQYDDYATYQFDTYMGAIGVGHLLTLNKRSFLKSSIVLMGQKISEVDDTLTRQQQSSMVGSELYYNSGVSFTSSYNLKFSPVLSMKTGFFMNYINYAFTHDELDFATGNFQNVTDGKGKTWLLQPYWQMSWKVSNIVTINPGLHYMYLTLNNTAALDPRLSAQFRLNGRNTLTLAYGLYSRMLPLGSYFYKQSIAPEYPNLNLKMMRSHHWVATHDILLPKSWRVHTELYYQHLLNIPVVDDPARTYWLLNQIDGYAEEALVSKGKGRNMGVDLSAEKFFSKGFFMISSVSVFQSTYQPLNGKSYSTQFNSRSSASWVGAKEWSLKKNKVLQFGWKMIYNGGLPITPLLPGGDSREPVLDESKPFSDRVPAYFRTDTRISLRKDKTKVSWQLALDVQNIFGIQNTSGLSYRYDPTTNQWVYKKQSGLVPVLSYQIDF